MALTDSEIARLKAEMQTHLLSIGADPYIGHAAYWTQVLQPYISGGASTTSSTAVTAATSPTPVALTLTSATGFAAGITVIVDVDSRQEQVTVQSLSGSALTVQLTKAHSGTYPVVVEGPESIIREYLTKLRSITAAGGAFDKSISRAGIKRVDEIEFFGDEAGASGRRDLVSLQRHYRRELAALLGFPFAGGAGGTLSPY